MNIDDFKSRTHRVVAPDDAFPDSAAPAESFLQRMKERDRIEHRWLMAYAGILLSVGIVFLVTALSRHASGFQMIAIGYMLIAAVAWLRSRQFARVQYTCPTIDFLASAQRRYRFWRPTDWLFAVPLGLLLAFGGGVTVMDAARRYLSPAGQTIALIIYVVFFVLVVVLGASFSWKDWKRQNGELFLELKKMRKELANG